MGKRKVYLIKTENGYKCANPDCLKFTKKVWKRDDSDYWTCETCNQNKVEIGKEKNDNQSIQEE